MAYTAKISWHEIKKDKGIIVSGVIGITITDSVSGILRYVDKTWVIGEGGDFETVPTKAEFKAAVKAWLTDVPEGGQSILQGLKASIQRQTDEIVTVFEPGDAGSMVGEEIQGVLS